jgi:hypothetical protein
MKIRRLNFSDVSQLNDLVNSKSEISDVIPDNHAVILQYRARWLEGMKLHYLTGKDTHYLYGAFKDDELISCMSWRCDLPEPWNDGWVVGNLKAKPGHSIRSNGLLELWTIMFEICEAKGLKRWHMVIPQNNSRRYQAVADRYFKEIDSSYDYEWSMVIPANTIPDVDWVWGTMGRIKLNSEIRVRTGTKKCEQT